MAIGSNTQRGNAAGTAFIQTNRPEYSKINPKATAPHGTRMATANDCYHPQEIH